MIQTLPYPASWHPFLKFIGEHAGTDTKVMAEAMALPSDSVSKTIYSIWSKQDKAAPLLLRQQMERPTKGGRPLSYYRFFTPDNCPAYLRDDLLAFLRGAPVLAGPDEVAAPVKALSADALLSYVYEYPGCTAVEIAMALNGDPTRVAGSLLAVMKSSKRQPPRVDRVPSKPGGNKDYRWYHPDAVPDGAASELKLALAAEAYREQQNALAEAQAAIAQSEATAAAPVAEAPTAPCEASPPVTPTALDPSSAVRVDLGLPADSEQWAPHALARIVDDFVARTADAIVTQVKQRLMAMVAMQMEAALADLPAQLLPAPSNVVALTAPAKLRRPKVVVVGLKPEQAHIIGNEFSGRLHLSFHEACHGADKLRDSLSHAQHAMLMTKFINHSHQGAVKKSGVAFTYIDGGMDSLRHALNVACKVAEDAAA